MLGRAPAELWKLLDSHDGGRLAKVTSLLTGAFYVGNGWVAGGCWDDYETSDYGSFPQIPC